MKCDKKENLDKNKENLHPYFIKMIKYNIEPWLTDFIFGQRWSDSHGHATLSGGGLWYLRDEEGKVIIKNGSKLYQ